MLKQKTLAVLVLMGAMALASVAMFGQAAQSVPGTGAQPHSVTDQDIQMLRADIRAQRKDLTAQNMTLTPDEATKFWPLYDQYMGEVTKIGDTRWALIQDYAKNYNAMTDAQAQDFIKKSGAVDQQFTALRLKYVPIFEKVISPKKAALWYQIDRRLDLLINLQLAALIPVVDTTK